MNSSIDARPRPDVQLEAVANLARRRLLITLLDGTPFGKEPIDASEFVDTADSPESLVDMRHTHLPKLEGKGFIRWNQNTDYVSQGPQFGEIEPLLTMLYESRDELPEEWL